MKRNQLRAAKQILALGVVAAVLLGILTLGYLLLRFFYVALFVEEEEKRQPQTEQVVSDEEAARRNIYDRRFQELAIGFQLASVYALPLKLENPEKAAVQLAELLELDEKKLVRDMKSKRSFMWVEHQVEKSASEEIRKLGLEGVYVIDEPYRYYPNNYTAAHVVGFAKDNHGLAGVESYYDSLLRGGVYHETGFKEPVPVSGATGMPLILTLDLRIQSLLEEQLKILQRKTDAKAATALVMASATGEILGLASLPSYNPNLFWESEAPARRNRAVTDSVFPGGLNRVFQLAAVYAAAGAPKGAVNVKRGNRAGNAWIKLQPGVYTAPVIPHNETMPDSLDFNEIAAKLGLTAPSEVDLPVAGSGGTAQEAGRFAYSLDDYTSRTTAVHVLRAFNCLVNGGRLVRPHVAAGLWDGRAGRRIPVNLPSGGHCVAPEVSSAVRSALQSAVKAGPGKSLFMESLVSTDLIALKAQAEGEAEAASVRENRPAKGERFHAVMLGMAPENNPRITMVVVLEEARISRSVTSPLRTMGRNVVRNTVRWAKEPPLAVFPVKPESGAAAAYRKWKSLTGGEKMQPPMTQTRRQTLKRPGGTMPDVRGYSLRKALQVLQPYNLQITVQGAGRVVRQQPKAGKKISGDTCVLELRRDN